MKKSLLAFAVAAAIVAPEARATTFPALTTIYFASGAVDNSNTSQLGVATIVSCSNLSGQTASVRYQFRAANGTLLAGGTLLLASLAQQYVTTQGGVDFVTPIDIQTGPFLGGTVQILSTQSAIYCSAMLVHADGASSGPAGVALHMVRLNPHPGTVE
jgi:hypothetical protein